MITKIDLPKLEGAKIYDNKGSCGVLANYLISNSDKLDSEEFFNLNRDDLTKTEAIELIDNNVKGLRRTETKFISLSINPSHEEVKHIGNDKVKMKNYVRQCMSNYAAGFAKHDIKPSDLVWTAVIHEHRYFTNKDKSEFEKEFRGLKFQFKTKEEVESFKNNYPGQECPFEKLARKPGHNMHAHVIVSKRDSKMKKTLSPHVKKGSFSIVDFQKANQQAFQNSFDFKKGSNLYKEMQIDHISKIVGDINSRNASVIDLNVVLKMEERGLELNKACYNLKQLNMDLYRSKAVDDVYKYIEVGKTSYWKEVDMRLENNQVLDIKPKEEGTDNGLFTSLLYELQSVNRDFNDTGQTLKEDVKRKRKHQRRNNL